MHKVYLTEEECSIIQGAQDIIDVLGGFPSMEDGELVSIGITANKNNPARYDVSLLFDISGWIRVCGFNSRMENAVYQYPNIVNPKYTRIRLSFEQAENIVINGINMDRCGEIKFTDTWDRRAVRQDDHPSTTPRIKRPFLGFGIRYGEDFFISFFEGEVTIWAKFE